MEHDKKLDSLILQAVLEVERDIFLPSKAFKPQGILNKHSDMKEHGNLGMR